LHWADEAKRLTAIYIIDAQADPKSAKRPVKNFPILAKLLVERVATKAVTAVMMHGVKSVVYRASERRNHSRSLAI
jgi:hypothetical protein